MAEIDTHFIFTQGGRVKLLEFVKNQKYKFNGSFTTEKALEYAKQIAATEDTKARNLMLKLLNEGEYMQRGFDELKKDFETIARALESIEAELRKKAEQ